MGIFEGGLEISKFIPGLSARPCDTCRSTAAVLFCRAHSLFLCVACDAKVHASSHARHARMPICHLCKHAPVSVTCGSNATMLCDTCDCYVHSTNPLAHRHERIPVVPFFDTAEIFAQSVVRDDAITSSCLLLNTTATKLETGTTEMECTDYLFSDSDQFLDFDCKGTDSVVLAQTLRTYEEATVQHVTSQLSNKDLEIDFTNSKINSVNLDHNHSISSSSMDVGLVPDGSSMSDTSCPCIQSTGNTIDLSCSTTTTSSRGSDREARVMRYREKRKNRKFEKTIRYASRKAYAEARPRIKGRFAKRVEPKLESMSNSSAFMSETAG